MQEISQKARQVLEYLTQRESSIPPTVREIGAALQIKSTSTVHKYLTELAAAGYIEKGDKMNRAISLPQQQSAKVPLLGVVTAGQPILAVEDIEGYVPYQGGRYPANELFALRVRGESMIEAGSSVGILLSCTARPRPRMGRSWWRWWRTKPPSSASTRKTGITACSRKTAPWSPLLWIRC